MIKCKDKGVFTCISRNGNPKVKFDTDKIAIEYAKHINEKYHNENSKLVAYKCTHCGFYHMTTKFKNKSWS